MLVFNTFVTLSLQDGSGQIAATDATMHIHRSHCLARIVLPEPWTDKRCLTSPMILHTLYVHSFVLVAREAGELRVNWQLKQKSVHKMSSETLKE